MFSYLCIVVGFLFTFLPSLFCLDQEKKDSFFFFLYMIEQDCVLGGILNGYGMVATVRRMHGAFVTWNQNIETDLSNARSYVTKTIAPFQHHLSFFRKGMLRIVLWMHLRERRERKKSVPNEKITKSHTVYMLRKIEKYASIMLKSCVSLKFWINNNKKNEYMRHKEDP